MSEARGYPPPPGALNDAVPPSPSKWGHVKQHARHWVKSYVLYHFLAFAVAALLGGMAIALIENSSYINGLFNAMSALSVTGLTVFDLARVKLATQLVTFFLMILGSTSLVSVVPVVIRSVILSRRVPAIKAAADAERARIELRAMRRLTVLVPLYALANILFGFLATGFYTQFTTDVKPALRASNVGPWWASLFISSASFANAGFSPFSDNLVPYRRSPFPLLVYAYLILAGNTWLPIVLRLLLRIRVRLARLFRHGTEDYEYTLKHPRRVYTHLFSAHATWILVGVQTALIVLQWVTAMGFDWHHNLNHLSPALKVVNTFFMSVSTRTAGFNTVNLATEAPPVQVMQLVMMYLSALPVALSIRSSADEAWAPDADLDAAPATPSRPKRFRSLLRRALQRDLFLLVAAYWLLSAIERDRIEPADGEAPLSLFRLLYELVSAYGTVGLSLSTTPASLSASLHPASRLVLTGVMLAGRHRGLGLLLPLELDQALPRAGAPVAHAEVV